jgi:hypothetical protein
MKKHDPISRSVLTALFLLSTLPAGSQAQDAAGTEQADSWAPVPQAKAPASAVSGSGTTGRIPKWTASNTLGNSVLVEKAGRIGLGTPLPSVRLDVVGHGRIQGELTLSPPGDMALDVASGSVYMGGALFLHDRGSANVAVGRSALTNVTTGDGNAALGYGALVNNTTGYSNVGVGSIALSDNTTGNRNTAIGRAALYRNTTGFRNTAVGTNTLLYNTTGFRNTAVGAVAMQFNTTGYRNTALGNSALFSNTTGYQNTASGNRALTFNTTGARNTAAGYRALYHNVSGSSNTALGTEALFSQTTGTSNVAVGAHALRMWDTISPSDGRNTAVGAYALYHLTGGGNDLNTAVGKSALESLLVGKRNIALGQSSGSTITTGYDNIHIGNYGTSYDTSTIRIGTVQDRTFIAGIRGTTTGSPNAIPVLIDSAGQLGTISSSRRFKEDIRDMEDATGRLLALRPVTFQFKPEVRSVPEDDYRPLEYGLIAEEVAEVFPDLVVYDGEGRPETVKYHLLGTMLLNELQKQAEEIVELRARDARMAARLTALEQRE